jgi:hypothetical protein
MKTYQKTTGRTFACSRQERIETEAGPRWRWISPGCPFAQTDVSDACWNCGLLTGGGETSSVEGPTDSGLDPA